MHPELIERLSRQTLLPQIGEEGRDRIAAARFLVIGAGGLGSPALQYLAASGAVRITVADGDEVSVSNLSRQLLHDESRLGMNKAESAAAADALSALIASRRLWALTTGLPHSSMAA